MKRTFPFATLTLALASVAAFSTAGFAQTEPPQAPCEPGAACEMPAGPMGGPMAGQGPMGGPMGGPDDIMGRGMGGGMGPGFDFTTLDADKDGKVTQAEIDAPRLARVTGLDANNDGMMSAAELSAMFMVGMQARADQHAARMLERHDSDGDGQISAAEFAAGPRPVNMIARMDTDGDGAISQAEADAAQERMQDRRGDRRDGGKREGRHGRHGRD